MVEAHGRLRLTKLGEDCLAAFFYVVAVEVFGIAHQALDVDKDLLMLVLSEGH